MNTAKHAAALGAGLASLLLLASCNGSSEGTQASSSSSPSTSTPTSRAVPTPEPAAEAPDLSALDTIPTTDELETQLAESVTDANADAEFEKLAKDLEAEGGG